MHNWRCVPQRAGLGNCSNHDTWAIRRSANTSAQVFVLQHTSGQTDNSHRSRAMSSGDQELRSWGKLFKYVVPGWTSRSILTIPSVPLEWVCTWRRKTEVSCSIEQTTHVIHMQAHRAFRVQQNSKIERALPADQLDALTTSRLGALRLELSGTPRVCQYDSLGINLTLPSIRPDAYVDSLAPPRNRRTSANNSQQQTTWRHLFCETNLPTNIER